MKCPPTDKVVPVLVVKLCGDGDDPAEEVRGKPEVLSLQLSLYVVLPQSIRPAKDQGS